MFWVGPSGSFITRSWGFEQDKLGLNPISVKEDTPYGNPGLMNKRAGSISMCNGGQMTLLCKHLKGGGPVETFSQSGIESLGDGVRRALCKVPDRSVPLGNYWNTNLLVPHCQGLC